MFALSSRPNGYKLGLFFLALGFIFYTVGFASPYWTTFRMSFHAKKTGHGRTGSGPETGPGSGSRSEPLSRKSPNVTTASTFAPAISDYLDYNSEPQRLFIEVRGHDGMWESCAGPPQLANTMCVTINHDNGAPAWMTATQGTQSVGLIAMVGALGYAVIVNLVQRSPTFTRITEVVAIVASGLGCIGAIVFAVEIQQEIAELEEDLQAQEHLQEVTVEFNHLAWAFGINITGCCLTLIGALLVARYNRKIQDHVVVGAFFSNAAGVSGSNIPGGSASAGATTSGAIMAAVAAQPAVTDGCSVAVSAPFTSSTSTPQLYFIHPQQMAGGFCPPPYDPHQVCEIEGAPGATGFGPEVCFDDLALTSNGEKV